MKNNEKICIYAVEGKYKQLLYGNKLDLFNPDLFLDSLTDTDQQKIYELVENKNYRTLNKILDSYIEKIRNTKKPTYGLTGQVIRLKPSRRINFHKKPSLRNIHIQEILLLDKREFERELITTTYTSQLKLGCSQMDEQNHYRYLSDYAKYLTKENIWCLLKGLLENFDTAYKENFAVSNRMKVYISLYVTIKNKKY